ncbi:CAP domain-containing protein [Paracoccus sp. TK19116]|uniref:CAP domain-containing protein n=1 Tax=Paracoccus albicereus TaxID=2922394 RepID=A0ABT1MTT1_9RHOB|nr:CAP domain-containing protein [Paracoccus albicereus]MCQ0971722.1 CAP domain-containing protein [Paracoccus albicereus]
MRTSRMIVAAFGMGAVAALSACEQSSVMVDEPGYVLDGVELAEVEGVQVETGVPVPPASQSLAASCTADAAGANALADAINAARSVEGKVLLDRNETLDGVAQSHACDMVRMGQATVAGSNGSNVVDRARAVGYPTCGVIQLAQVGGSPTGIVNAWLNSPPHREQVLGQLSDEIGVGVTTGADGRQWWSVVMGDNCR